jgi:hypothetical protein
LKWDLGHVEVLQKVIEGSASILPPMRPSSQRGGMPAFHDVSIVARPITRCRIASGRLRALSHRLPGSSKMTVFSEGRLIGIRAAQESAAAMAHPPRQTNQA